LPLHTKPLGKRSQLILQRQTAARHNRPIQRLPTTGTIAGTAGIIAIIIQARRSNSFQEEKTKGGARRLPLFAFYCVDSEVR
jgi:hypothetical protein